MSAAVDGRSLPRGRNASREYWRAVSGEYLRTARPKSLTWSGRGTAIGAGGRVYLITCPECDRPNPARAVRTGQCEWCGRAFAIDQSDQARAEERPQA